LCGLFGLIHPDRDIVRGALRAGTAAVAHRGPDDHGEEVAPFGAGFLGLGHRRLSILDPSPLGHQPMAHVVSGCRIIFNGEIYNFQRLRAKLEAEGEIFRSASDTEVLLAGLARYGAAYLKQLEGMYALAFLDARTSTMILARDPAGIKPLYLAEAGEGFLFASETRAILATGLVRRSLDRRGVAGYLAYGAVQHPLTVFSGITSLPPGACLTVGVRADGTWAEAGKPKVFWRLPPPRTEVNLGAAVDLVRGTLDAAVRDHLVADTPIGLFLSSGLDSTIVAGLAAKHAPALKSFTVVFNDEPDFSERHLAAESARLFGLDHLNLPFPFSAAEATLTDWLASLDQPSIDGLNVYFIARAVREKGIKVALTGLGADELFGGYPSFRDVPHLWCLSRVVRPLTARMRGGVAAMATVGRSQVVRAKMRDMLSGNGSLRSLCLRRRRLMTDAQLKQLGLASPALELDLDFLTAAAAPDVDTSSADPFRVISQSEFRLYQGNMLLRDADMNGMAFGMELRVPYLDQRLLNLVHALPGLVRVPRWARSKHLLRKAFPELLRPTILNQRKHGFSLPIASWMAGSLRPKCEHAITALKDSRLLQPHGITAVWNGFLREPKSPMWSRAFALVVLGEFCREHSLTA